MTVYEHRGEAIVVDARHGLPARRAPRRRFDFARLQLPDRARQAGAGGDPHPRARGSRRRAALSPARDRGGGGLGDQAHARLRQSKLDEHGLSRATTLREAEPDKGPVDIGPFKVDFVRVAHSIPDAIAVVIETSAGRIVYTGDYKMDHTPVDGIRTDVGRLAELGNLGVDLMLGDSTNAERPGHHAVRAQSGRGFPPDRAAARRAACSCLLRFQHPPHSAAIDVAIETGRSVAVIGRSMRKNVNIARNLGYLDVPDEILLKPEELSQLASLRADDPLYRQPGRAALGADQDRLPRHAKVKIERGRHGHHLAKAIPGNELRVHDAINGLAKAGAEVLHEEIAEVHASGHACAEELRTMLALLRPKTLMPVHGEFRMQAPTPGWGWRPGFPKNRS